MNRQLQVSVGQVTRKGRKPCNQDFHGVIVPREPLLGTKGIAVALADGISSSDVSQIASEVAVKGFLEDYYATPESWSVKTSAQRVLQATNSWLSAQSRNGPHRHDLNRGYVCTFSALVLKSSTAHLFHVGDTRIYRLSGQRLEQLTDDHRLWASPDKSYLSRALGIREHLEFDYATYALEVGDTYLLMSDGVYEFSRDSFVADTIRAHSHDLDQAAQDIVDNALDNGSDDNLSIQIIRVEALPAPQITELNQQAQALPFPPALRPRMQFDGYEILREVHGSSRSHVYLARDGESGQRVILKVPSVDLRNDAAYLERFLMEEWVARRVDNTHLLKPFETTRKRNFLYLVSEFVEGRALNQWMTDNPAPDLETVRDIVEQIARGLQALHRQEMLHQDLRPNNIMIDNAGTVKIIDFGAVRVAGVTELGAAPQPILGTAQYTAPEYFLGEPGSTRSDLFSLGVIAYQMLSGRLPYGPQVARASSRAAQNRLAYTSVLDDRRTIPAWIDGALRKAVQANPHKRYQELSEFIHDLRHPNQALTGGDRPPLMERNPLLFWKGVSLVLFIALLLLSSTHPLVPLIYPTPTEQSHDQAGND